MFKRAVVKAAQNPLGGKETKKLRIDIQKRLDITDDELDAFFAVRKLPRPAPPGHESADSRWLVPFSITV
jgi:hypothetical protein